MSLQEKQKLEEFQTEIDKQILEIDETAFVDGIINIDNYLNQSIRVLWILKEPNHDGGEKLNWRDEIKKLNDGTGNLSGFAKTFSNIIYVSYGILERKKWNEIKWIQDDPNIVNVLEKISFINIKKTPGGSVSNDNELQEFYDKYKKITLEQIKIFNPNVIIGGKTIKFLINDLKEIYPNLEYKEKIERTNLGVSSSKEENVIVFDAYHPGARISNENYFNDIVDAFFRLIQSN